MPDPNSDVHDAFLPEGESGSSVDLADENSEPVDDIHDGPKKDTPSEETPAEQASGADPAAGAGEFVAPTTRSEDDAAQESNEDDFVQATILASDEDLDASDALATHLAATGPGESGVPLFEPVEDNAGDEGLDSNITESEENSAASPPLPTTVPEMSMATFGDYTPATQAGGIARMPAPAVASEPAKPAKPSSPLIMVLFTWASIATILAIWMWKNWPEAPSPLDTLPDDGIKTSKNIISPLEKLSHRELFTLGETKRIGDLNVTPVAVEYRPVDLIDAETGRQKTDPVLVLTLRLQNVSQTHAFHPTDPVYFYPDRRDQLQGYKQFRRRGYTYTFLHPQSKLDDLIFCFNLGFDIGMKFEGQSFPRLEPGESAEVVVVSEEVDLSKLADAMVWRVKLRKGKTRTGKGVATVIGVQFNKNEIQTAS